MFFKVLSIITLVAYIVAFITLTKRKFFATFILNIFAGLGTLFLLKTLEGVLNIDVHINTISFCSAMVFGPFGAIINVIADYYIF